MTTVRWRKLNRVSLRGSVTSVAISDCHSDRKGRISRHSLFHTRDSSLRIRSIQNDKSFYNAIFHIWYSKSHHKSRGERRGFLYFILILTISTDTCPYYTPSGATVVPMLRNSVLEEPVIFILSPFTVSIYQNSIYDSTNIPSATFHAIVV